jgi:branched-chain amino acid transport system substrate-binding protein
MLAAVLIGGVTLPASAQPAPYTFEVILPMTGQAAFSGQAESQTLAAFEKYVNANGGVRGGPIHFDIKDDQTSPQVALQLTNAIVAQHVPVLFGSAVVATCASIGAAVSATGPVQFCFSPGYSPPKDSYSFATGIATVAINAELFASPDLRGIQLVADERVSTGDVSAAAQLAKIKAAKPDALWTSTSGTVFGTVIHAMSDVGLDVPVLTTTANASAAQLKPMAAFLPHELYFNGVPFQLGDLLKDADVRKQGRMFADAFKLIGVEPTPLHTLSWDSLLIAVAALRQFGPSMTADQLKTYALGLRHFPALNGNYDFSSGDQHGLDSNAVVIVGWDRDKQDFFPASQLGGIPIKR